MNPFDPLPTIKAILGMPIYEAVKESQILAHLDNFEPPRCEVPSHHVDTKARGHSGPATLFLITPCHHHDGYLCAPIAEWLKVNGNLTCVGCGLRLLGADMTFLPIGGAL